MKKERLYLDTSVPSACYDERAVEGKDATIKFWKEVLFHYLEGFREIEIVSPQQL